MSDDYRISIAPSRIPGADPRQVDDVCITNVSMFRMESMSERGLWIACYLDDLDDEVVFDLWASKKDGMRIRVRDGLPAGASVYPGSLGRGDE